MSNSDRIDDRIYVLRTISIALINIEIYFWISLKIYVWTSIHKIWNHFRSHIRTYDDIREVILIIEEYHINQFLKYNLYFFTILQRYW